MANEKATPVTEDEIDDIRVSLDLDDNTTVECKIVTIFEMNEQDYIALCPVDENDELNADGIVYIYRYAEDEEGLPSIDNIESEEEYEAAADKFDELLDEELYESM